MPIVVKLEVPRFAGLGIPVRYLKVVEKSRYRLCSWRKIMQNENEYRQVCSDQLLLLASYTHII